MTQFDWESRALADQAQWKYALPEVNDGAKVCKMLKEIFFEQQAWSECYMAVAAKFTDLKNLLRKIYPDKPTAEIVRELASYSRQDIEDVFG